MEIWKTLKGVSHIPTRQATTINRIIIFDLRHLTVRLNQHTSKHVYFKRASTTGPSLIQDMRYMAAKIIATAYIKDGLLIEYHTEPKETAIAMADKQGVWQDMG